MWTLPQAKQLRLIPLLLHTGKEDLGEINMRAVLLSILLLTSSASIASEWALTSITGPLTSSPDVYRVVIEHNNNTYVIEREVPAGRSLRDNTLLSYDTNVVEFTGNIDKSQQIGVLKQINNILMSNDDTAKSLRAIADLMTRRDEVMQEIESLRLLVLSQP